MLMAPSEADAAVLPHGFASSLRAPAPLIDHLMGLPRELRDMIYDHLTHDIDFARCSSPVGHHWQPYRAVADVSIKSAPVSAALRISKQFSTEYKEQISKISILVIKEAPRQSIKEINIRLPDFIHHVELHMLRDYRNGPEKIERRCCEWTDHLQLMSPVLLKFRVMIDFPLLYDECYYPDDINTIIRSAFQTHKPSSRPVPSAANIRALRLAPRIIDREDVSEIVGGYHYAYASGDEKKGVHLVYGTWSKAQGWMSGKIGEPTVDTPLKETEAEAGARNESSGERLEDTLIWKQASEWSMRCSVKFACPKRFEGLQYTTS